MSVIIKITDQDLGFESKEMSNPEIRMASRGIVINKDGLIAVIHKKLKHEYKLPGGGVENKEKGYETFQREVLEETGCYVDIMNYLGLVEEERSAKNFKQISYIYISKVLEDTRRLHRTHQEEDEQLEVVWMELDDAIEKIKGCYPKLKPSSYHDLYYTQFAVLRDQKILEYYKENKKPIRDAVRTFLIDDGKVACIEYQKGNVGFLDIPGGKIEEGETPTDASKREFLEETSLHVQNLDLIGTIFIEYPNRIYKMKVLLTHDFEGTPKNTDENKAYFIAIPDLLKKEKRYAITELLDKKYQHNFQKHNLLLKFVVDENHRILEVEDLN